MSRHYLQNGIAIIELLIAFSLITLVLSGVVLVASTNQSIVLDIEMYNAGIYETEKDLENVFAQAHSGGFAAITSDPDAPDTDTFTVTTKVADVSECVKRVESVGSWWRTRFVPKDVSLSTVFVSLEMLAALGGDCDTEQPEGDWDNPSAFDVNDSIHDGSQGTDVDVIKDLGKRFALLTTEKIPGEATLWMVDVTDPEVDPLPLVGAYDSGDDLYAVDATAAYVFVVGKPSDASLPVPILDAQLHIVDIRNLSVPVGAAVLPGVAGTRPEGISIYYLADRVYVGTPRTAGPEFHVFDVSNPTAPVSLGSLELNHNVHDIVVVGSSAYIASSANSCELIVIDVSDPSAMINPCPSPPIPNDATVFDAPEDFDGTAVYVLSGTVYLGRDRAQDAHDFYILDATNAKDISPLGSFDLEINSNTEVVGLKVIGGRAFVATSDTSPNNGGGSFIVLDVSHPSEIIKINNTCLLNYSEEASGFDFVDEIGFVANEANNALRIIYDAPMCI